MGNTEPRTSKFTYEKISDHFTSVVGQLVGESYPPNTEEGEYYDRTKSFRITTRTGLRSGINNDGRHFKYLHLGVADGEKFAVGLGNAPDKPPVYVFVTAPGNPLQVYGDGVYMHNLTSLEGDEAAQHDLLAAYQYVTLQIEDRMQPGELMEV